LARAFDASSTYAPGSSAIERAKQLARFAVRDLERALLIAAHATRAFAEVQDDRRPRTLHLISEVRIVVPDNLDDRA
jgi:hypothetical protein